MALLALQGDEEPEWVEPALAVLWAHAAEWHFGWSTFLPTKWVAPVGLSCFRGCWKDFCLYASPFLLCAGPTRLKAFNLEIRLKKKKKVMQFFYVFCFFALCLSFHYLANLSHLKTFLIGKVLF